MLTLFRSTTIVEECLQGDLVKGRTVILVVGASLLSCSAGCVANTCPNQTHNIALAGPMASFVVTIGQDGAITGQETDMDLSFSSNPALMEAARRDAEGSEISSKEVTLLAKKETPIDGKLILKEEISHGRVDWKSLRLFFSALGGGHSVSFFGIWLSSFVLSFSTTTFTKWFLGYWGSQYENHNPSEVNVA